MENERRYVITHTYDNNRKVLNAVDDLGEALEIYNGYFDPSVDRIFLNYWIEDFFDKLSVLREELQNEGIRNYLKNHKQICEDLAIDYDRQIYPNNDMRVNRLLAEQNITETDLISINLNRYNYYLVEAFKEFELPENSANNYNTYLELVDYQSNEVVKGRADYSINTAKMLNNYYGENAIINVNNVFSGKDTEVVKEDTVYRGSLDYAIEHNEEDKYLDSFDKNIICKTAIESAIGDNYRNDCLNSQAALETVRDKLGFSMERISFILANSVQCSGTKFANEQNKRWAKNIPICFDDDDYKNISLIINHKKLLDLFITDFRKELDREFADNGRYNLLTAKKERNINFTNNHTSDILATKKIRDKIIIDTETTGFSRSEDEILQLSIVDGDTKQVLFDEYFKPKYKQTWEKAEAVNHISPEMVADKPDIFGRLGDIQKIIAEANTVIVYNAAFDVDFLEHYGIDFSSNVIDDPMCYGAVLYGETKEHESGEITYKWKKLGVLAEHLGYDGDGWHNSTADCLATAYVYEKIREPENIKKYWNNALSHTEYLEDDRFVPSELRETFREYDGSIKEYYKNPESVSPAVEENSKSSDNDMCL